MTSPAGVLALLVALLSGVLVTFGPATPAAAGEPEVIHSLVNEARAAKGLPPLNRNASLDAVAAAWAEELANLSSLKHNPHVGNQIPGGWSSWGENIAQGHQSGAAMQEGWMNSPGHHKNIMGDFSDIGVAFIQAGGTTWGVQVFAKYANGVGGGGAVVTPPAPARSGQAPAPESTVEQKAAEENAAAEQAAAEKAAADKAAAERKADEEAAAEQRKAAAEKEQSAQQAAAAEEQKSADRQAAGAGSAPTDGPTPGAEAAGRTDVPLSTSVTRALAPAGNPVVLIAMGIVLLLALVLLSPTLRRLVFSRRRQPRHR